MIIVKLVHLDYGDQHITYSMGLLSIVDDTFDKVPTETTTLNSIDLFDQFRNTQRYLRCSWYIMAPSMIKHLLIVTKVG